MITRILAALLLSCVVGLSAPPPILRNSWTTNTAGTPVRGVDNLSVTNVGSGTNWQFFNVGPKTIARLEDATNVVGNAISNSFNPNQFTVNANVVSISSAAPVTNVNIFTSTNQGHVRFSPDNTYDIGASGANRPASIYIATLANVSGNTISSGSGFSANAGSFIGWATRTYFQSPSDGKVTVLNNAGNNFNSLQLGGTTAAFPAWGRTNGNVALFGGDGLFAGGNTNNLVILGGWISSFNGVYHKTNGTAVATITAGLANGDCWVGMLSNRLHAVCMSNSAVTFKVLAP